MESVTQLIVRIANLCEAEGRTLRAMTVRLAFAVAIIWMAAAALAAGAALLFAALYITIDSQAGAAVAALTTGLLALGIGGTLAWLGRRIGN